MRSNLKKSFFWNTLGSGFNSINSLFLLVIVTRINGVNNAGIFTLSFATACILYIIAVYSGRTYQVTENDKEVTDNEYIINRLIMSIVMLLISFLFAILNKYDSYKMIIFMLVCLFKCIEAVCDVFHGILQKNDKLDIVGKSLLIRSLLNIIIFLIVDLLTKNLIVSCISLICTNLLVLFAIDIRKSLKYKEKVEKISIQPVLKIFTFGFYTFGFSLISTYIVNAPRYAIDRTLGAELQAIFSIIVMPGTVIMLANQFIIQPIIIRFKKAYENKKKKDFLNLTYKIIGFTILVGIFVIGFSYFFGIPIINMIYGLKLNSYLTNLLLVLIGATFYTIASVFSNCLIVLRKTKIQFVNNLVVAIFAYIVSFKLVDIMGFSGATYSYLLIMLLLLIIYLITFLFIVSKKEIWE